MKLLSRLFRVLSVGGMIAVLFVGCSESDSAKVSGRVTLDGEPLDRGQITFVALGEGASGGIGGTIKEDGTYSIQIGRSGQVASGEYAVKVIVLAPSIPGPEGGPPMPGELITPNRYSKTATSGLRYHIRPGDNVIDISLNSETGASEEETDEQDAEMDEEDQGDEEDGSDPVEDSGEEEPEQP